MPTATETETQAAILEYLTLKKYLCWRMNNIPASYIDRHGERQFRKLPKFTMKGLPDIALIHPMTGRFYGIECKSASGKLSPEQAEFGRLCVRAGAEFIVARSLEDVISAGL